MDKYFLLHALKELHGQSKKQKTRGNGITYYKKFTINGIPIQKVFVRGVLPKLTDGRLKKLFSHYGPVQRVEIVEQPRPRKKKCAIVTFKDPESAEAALQQQFIDISRYRLFVFPAYGMIEVDSGASSSREKSADSQAVGEIMTEINLPNGLPYKVPENLLTFSFFQGIFNHSGTALKKLNLQKAKIFGADALIEAIVSTCSVLEDLRLEGLYIDDRKIDKLKALNKLKVISLIDCNPIKDHHVVSLLEKNTVLTHLEVTCTNYLRGNFLHAVCSPLQILDLSFNGQLYPSKIIKGLKKVSATLQHFSISGCKNVENDEVDRMVEKLPNLRSLKVARYDMHTEYLSLSGIADLKFLETLDLSDNEHVNEFVLKDLRKNALQLKSLDISGSDVDANCGTVCISRLKSMPNLTTLNLGSLRYLNGKTIRNYVAGNPPVESLILAGCHQLEDEDIIRILNGCQNLKMLDLSECCKISEAVLNAAVETLNKRSNNQPLHLLVGGTKIKKPKEAKSYHPLLSIEYIVKKEDDDDDSLDPDDEYDDSDWTHLMKGVGCSSYYLASDEDDSDFDRLNTSDFDSDRSEDDEKYDIDPTVRTYGGFSPMF